MVRYLICESVIAGMLQILEHMTNRVVVNSSWAVAELAQLDHGEVEVGTADVAGPIRVDVAEKGRRRDVGRVGMTKAILWIGAHRWWSWYIWELRTWCGT
jgi:hypothetical protein